MFLSEDLDSLVIQEFYIRYQLQVKDYGTGIPPEKMQNLFINFSKIEENSSNNKNGVGLGLSICKNLIE